MLNLEFIQYKATPADKYMLGIATVRIDKKYIVRFKAVKAKDGGVFYSSPSFTLEEYGEKKYLSSFQLDSRIDEETLFEFIRKNVHEVTQATSAIPKVTYANEVGVNDQLPF